MTQEYRTLCPHRRNGLAGVELKKGTSRRLGLVERFLENTEGRAWTRSISACAAWPRGLRRQRCFSEDLKGPLRRSFRTPRPRIARIKKTKRKARKRTRRKGCR